MKAIITPTNFSATSVNAVNFAAHLALSVNARLYIVHYFQIPVPALSGETFISADTVSSIMEDAEKEMRMIVKTIRKSMNHHLHIHTAVIEGQLEGKLHDYCTSLEPLCVVMGTEESSGMERLFFGTNTIHSMRHLSWPVMIVPPGITFNGFERIALATDFRKVPGKMDATRIRELLTTFHSSLHIIHVTDDKISGYNAETITHSPWMKELLEDSHAEYHFIEGDNIEKEIFEYCDKNKINLLVIIPKIHGLLKKIFFYSHSKQLALHTPIPLMAIHE